MLSTKNFMVQRKSCDKEKGLMDIFICAFFYSREKAKEAMIYSYNKHINGFAALLEEEQASYIESEHSSIVTSRE
jgi:hypothetical protein